MNNPQNQKMKHLVVILAYHYPPENVIGAARPYRFVKYLSRLGYTCRVFTAADQTGRYDPNTEYVEDPFFTNPRYSFNWQFERAIRKLFLPGEVGMQWSYRASRAACKYIRAHSWASVTILSSFPPLGSHLAGWQAARNSKVTWLADCRDPFTDDITDRHETASKKHVHRWMERIALRRADGVVVNTDAAQMHLKAKFPSCANKLHVIWNGFDPEERIGPLPIQSRNRKTLSHVGELYNGRNVSPMLESVARLIAADRLRADSIRIRLIGPAESDCLPGADFSERARSEGWLDLVTERIPQGEARQVAQSSDGLLLMESESTSHIPAKIFEYLQIGRPILAFTRPDSPAERLLKRSGVPFRIVHPNATPETTDSIMAEFLSLPCTPVAANAWFEEEFNAEKQTLQLHGIIRSLHNRAGTNILPAPIISAEASGAGHPQTAGSYSGSETSAIASIDRLRT
jgi:glycosyltransferase involved in cell wall biosynthesis